MVRERPPRRVRLSAGDTVRLSVTKAQHGLVPNFVGSSLEGIGPEVKRLKLRVKTTPGRGPLGMVLRQSLDPGVTSRPGLRISLVVGDGSRNSIP